METLESLNLVNADKIYFKRYVRIAIRQNMIDQLISQATPETLLWNVLSKYDINKINLTVSTSAEHVFIKGRFLDGIVVVNLKLSLQDMLLQYKSWAINNPEEYEVLKGSDTKA